MRRSEAEVALVPRQVNDATKVEEVSQKVRDHPALFTSIA
jgi:hypothetical protein